MKEDTKKRYGIRSVITEPPEVYPVLERALKVFLPTEDVKNSVEKMRELEMKMKGSGYYIPCERNKYEDMIGGKRVNHQKGRTDLLSEMPMLSRELFPMELIRGLKLNKIQKDTNSSFLSSQMIELTLAQEDDDGEMDVREDEEEEVLEDQAENDDDNLVGGDYDALRHVDDDEDNVVAFED